MKTITVAVTAVSLLAYALALVYIHLRFPNNPEYLLGAAIGILAALSFYTFHKQHE